jgi:uncharacterized cupredoxin-like copper-binding protein
MAAAAAQEATPTTAAARCPSPLATPTAAPIATPVGEPVCVGVTVGEFSIRPERTTFEVGETYVFAVGNEGQDLHEFVIEPAGSTEEAALEADVAGEEREAEIEEIAPGQVAELTWTFTEPGSYQFACHLLDHYQRGMVIEIEVVETAAAGLSAADTGDYIDEMSLIDTTVRESLARYDELAQDPQLLNPEWLFKTAFEFALWRSGHENALALTPPPAFAESHGLYLEALGLLAEVSDDVAAAADEGDLMALMQIGPKITRATGLLDQATDLMANVIAEQGG